MYPVHTPQEENVVTNTARNQRIQHRLKQQLELIESMPDSAAIDVRIVSVLKGRSIASIWRDVKAGRIAQPFKAGPRSTRWRLGDVRGPDNEHLILPKEWIPIPRRL